MPRGRGGERQGTPGTAYGNRTDLNMPISTVPGQDYGKAATQRAAQQAVPMGQAPQAPVAPAVQKAPAPQPGSMPYIADTLRPNEPVTTGLPFGPGPGPEAMQNVGRAPLSSSLSAMIRPGGNSSILMDLADSARNLGL